MMWHEEEYNDGEYDAPYGYRPQSSEHDMRSGGHADMDYDRRHMQKNYIIPEVIKDFLKYFQKSINDQNVYEIQNAYENGFNKLTDRFFKNTPWPESDIVAGVIHKEHSNLFLILYKELYYRHVYARVQGGPTLEQRFESYYNYCNLFNYILSAGTPVLLELPNQWLWDIIDEFIYQFQSYSHYRCKVAKKKDDELELLRQNPKVWNVHSVLNVLHSFVEKSNIDQQLEVFNATGGDPSQSLAVAGEFGRHRLYKMLGYFSLVGLLRLHSLLGDYHQALKVVNNMNVNRKPMNTQVPACHVTMCYYVGFAYMMMRRYQDAIRTLANVLLFIQRTKQHFQSRTYLYDQINKQNDQMSVLLTICLVLHPICIDETIYSQLREKYTDRMLKMQKGDISEFENSFQFACPKFLSPVPPNYDGPLSPTFHKESYLQQLRVFIKEATHQDLLPTIRSYLKLYTTLPISKLASFMDMKEEDLITRLMCFKHKMQNVVWTKGTSALEGEFQSSSEVDFYIDKDMIHIADTTVARRYGDFFVRNIHKFEELNRMLQSINKH